jgi:hypothetical protein
MAQRPGVRRHRVAAQVPDRLRQEVTSRATDLLSRRFRVDAAEETRARGLGFNCVVAVFGEWRGQSYYLCAKYRTPRGDPPEEFVVRTTRLAYVGFGRFDLAYFRHTNRWQPVYSALTAQECFETIEQEEVFWPVT